MITVAMTVMVMMVVTDGDDCGGGSDCDGGRRWG